MSVWTWEFARFDGAPVPPAPGDGRRVRPRQPVEGFPVQVDAETWIGQSWRALVASGVDVAHLHRDGVAVHGPLELATRERGVVSGAALRSSGGARLSPSGEEPRPA